MSIVTVGVVQVGGVSTTVISAGSWSSSSLLELSMTSSHPYESVLSVSGVESLSSQSSLLISARFVIVPVADPSTASSIVRLPDAPAASGPYHRYAAFDPLVVHQLFGEKLSHAGI